MKDIFFFCFFYKFLILNFTKRKVKINSPSNFVLEGFARDNSNFLAYSLIRVEIKSETSVIFLDDDSSGLFDSFCPNATLELKKRKSYNIFRISRKMFRKKYHVKYPNTNKNDNYINWH